MKAFIYQLISKSGKSYIGSTTTTVKQRLAVHYSDLNRKVHGNYILQRAYEIHGKFKLKILQEFEYKDLKEVIQKEQFWMDKLKPEYNILKKAATPAFSPETRAKLSKALSGRSHSKARIKAIKLGLKKSKEAALAAGIPWKQIDPEKRKAGLLKSSIKNGKPLLMFSFEGYVRFFSRKEAVKITGFSETGIREALRTGKPTRLGFWFIYECEL